MSSTACLVCARTASRRCRTVIGQNDVPVLAAHVEVTQDVVRYPHMKLVIQFSSTLLMSGLPLLISPAIKPLGQMLEGPQLHLPCLGGQSLHYHSFDTRK